jgi:ribose 5-phosphate isomerase B
MKIFVGSDHAGFGLKATLMEILQTLGHEAIDKGAFEYNEEDDYNEFVVAVAREVSMHPNEVKGIIIGGSGQGEAMCANRFKHVRASVYYKPANSLVEDAMSILKLSRKHNNGNILSLGARFITEEEMRDAVKEWLETPFDGEEKYQRRIDKMDNIHD